MRSQKLHLGYKNHLELKEDFRFFQVLYVFVNFVEGLKDSFKIPLSFSEGISYGAY